MKRKRIEYSMADLIDKNTEPANIIIKLPQDFKSLFAQEASKEGKSLSYVIRKLMMRYLNEKGVIHYKPEIMQ
jgi:hypothetical protein